MTITIFSYAVNNNFPIDIQYNNFKKHIKENFEFILFNDANNSTNMDDINNIAEKLNIKCVKVPQEIHTAYSNLSPSLAYAETLNWSIQEYAMKNNSLDIILQVHTDVFPIKSLSIMDLLDGNAIATTFEIRNVDGLILKYFYPALTLIDLNSIKDVVKDLKYNCCSVNCEKNTNKHISITDEDNISYTNKNFTVDKISQRLDTGGMTIYFIEKHSSKKIKYLNNNNFFGMKDDKLNKIEAIKFDEKTSIYQYVKEDFLICQEYGLNPGWHCEGFYHYIAGSQWNSKDNNNYKIGHIKRLDLLYKYF